ncbi:carbohydrate ABC transporter permease [Phyllobacterium sp. BT25]|uniref:Maltose/maltodextrin transport system permease protein MalG n=1 Tax=Phyllobacterium pellucidum TaxID=2740464 RepID=A0A849VTQ4_9HYPH|nr:MULTISPECIES: carbohydrate ABC transporter permease [unclassified Phyllobacterium]NTS33066.1 carbohydrate ABC transporter permease [Phyllobacterium pellucidum]
MMSAKLKRSILFWILLSPIVVVILFPYAVMTISSLKSATEVLTPNWWPSELHWQNFPEMWRTSGIAPALANSLYVSALSTALTILVSIPAAYALSRYQFAGRDAFRQFLLVSQMLSPIVLVIGLFRLVAGAGMIDSLNVLVVIYTAFNIAFCVWMLQSYFSTIPRDLEEAAWMEGASRWRTLISVFLPLAVPAMVVTAIFTFINAWNEFVIALTMLRTEGSYTLPIRVFSLVAGRYTVDWHYVMAAAFVASVPVAVLFAWLQRYLVRGLSIGAVK